MAGRGPLLIAASAVILALVGAVVAVGRSPTPPDAVASGQPPGGEPTAAATPAVRLTTVRVPDAGFAIGYPAGWQRLEAEDRQVVLVAAGDRGGSLKVRSIDLARPVESGELSEFRQLTRDIVVGAEGVALLDEPRRIELAGVPGYFYFYAFEDSASDVRGAHAHYFLFHGDTLITIVFQALPVTRFDDLAALFDRIAATFTTLDQPAPAPSRSAADT